MLAMLAAALSAATNPCAHVSVYMGNIIWNGGAKHLNIGSYDIGVDGKVVGRVNSHEVLTLDLPPGHHTVTSYQHTIWGPKFPKDASVDVSDGETRFLAIDLYQRGNPNNPPVGVLFGAIGGLIQGIANSTGPKPGREPGVYLEEVPSGPQGVASLQAVASR